MKLGCKLFILTAILGLALGSQSLRAGAIDYSYSFSLVSSGDVTSTGVLTTTALTDGAYTIIGITGSRTANGITESIAGILPVNGFSGNDNLLFPNSPFLDGNGFSFYLTGAGGDDGKGDVNVYYDSMVGSYSESSSKVKFGSFSITPESAVPEPMPPTFAVIALFGAISWWRRKRLA